MQSGNKQMIMHLDLDSFYVSVERLRRPELKGKAVIIGGSRERGVVSTCSYECREYGVHSAMPMAEAMRKCPHATVLKGNMNFYRACSKRIREILKDEVPVLEQASIDEFYIDLSGFDTYLGADNFARELRNKLIDITKLPMSAGLAPTKLIAKILANEVKPDKYGFLPKEKVLDFLSPLSISKIPGIGSKAQQKLNYRGFNKIDDILNKPGQFIQYYGTGAEKLIDRLKGEYRDVVKEREQAKSISTERTFSENKKGKDELQPILHQMIEKLSFELRKKGLKASTVGIKFKTPDFKQEVKQISINATDVDSHLKTACFKVFDTHYKGQALRLIGVRYGNLSKSGRQVDLFNTDEKEEKVLKAIDQLKTKFGPSIITKAQSQQNKKNE